MSSLDVGLDLPCRRGGTTTPASGQRASHPLVFPTSPWTLQLLGWLEKIVAEGGDWTEYLELVAEGGDWRRYQLLGLCGHAVKQWARRSCLHLSPPVDGGVPPRPASFQIIALAPRIRAPAQHGAYGGGRGGAATSRHRVFGTLCYNTLVILLNIQGIWSSH
jgi:hypothetical protein